MSEGTITPEVRIRELEEKYETEKERLLKIFAAYESQVKDLETAKAEIEVLENEIIDREIQKETQEALRQSEHMSRAFTERVDELVEVRAAEMTEEDAEASAVAEETSSVEVVEETEADTEAEEVEAEEEADTESDD